MSVRRLVLTAAAMALIAGLFAAMAPSVGEMVAALASPQRTADTSGPDVLVLAAAGLLAWAVWAWGALGLALTAASALPGVLGTIARLTTQVVLPAGARRSAAVLLGVGLGVAAPLAVGILPGMTVPAAASSANGVPDWPAGSALDPAAGPAPAEATPSRSVPSTGTAVPDWPDPSVAPAEGSHVVVRGDCLWHIAETRLLEANGVAPTASEIAWAVDAWWTANADVIGPDPDRLVPGQILRPPGAA